MSKLVSERIPKAQRPIIPNGYGVPENEEGLLPWSYVTERMTAATNYWVATVDPKGRPHSTPVWGAWVDGACYIEGSPETKRARNLAKNPNVVVHLENGTEVVIIEGEAEEVIKPDRDFAVRMAKAMGDKYGDKGYRPEPNSWDEGGLHRIKPRLILAWSRFPADTTRWVFE